MGQAKQRGTKEQRQAKAEIIRMTCFTEDISKVNFDDVDSGYEDFAQALHKANFDWTKARQQEIQVRVLYYGYEAGFVLPKSKTCANGKPLIEFAVNAGLWQGINLVLKEARKLTSKAAMQGKEMTVIGNQLRVTLA